mgnify:CR=1 FL=1
MCLLQICSCPLRLYLFSVECFLFANTMDPDLEAAIVASLSDTAGRERTNLANAMLGQLRPVQPFEGDPFSLCLEHVHGDGFCFFRGIAGQVNLPNVDDVDVRLLAALAFAEVACTAQRDLIDDGEKEKLQRRECISQIPEYVHAARTGALDAFDFHVLDKMEGVLKADLSLERRYASLTDIVALLTHLELTCILLRPQSWKAHGAWREWLPHSFADVLDEDIQIGRADLLLVHHEGPEHFDSVRGVAGQRWAVEASKAQKVSALLHAWNPCPMVRKAIHARGRESLRHARLELLRFVVAQKPESRFTPEIPAWLSWVAFARNYDFGMGPRAVDADALRRVRTGLREHRGCVEDITWATCAAEALQWFFGPAFLLFRAVRAGDMELFVQYCISSDASRHHSASSDTDELRCFAFGCFRDGPEELVHRVHTLVHHAAAESVCYRGLKFISDEACQEYMRQLQTTGIAEVCSCSRDGESACRFMDPRAAHASLLVTDGRLRRCPALRAMQVHHRSGAFVVFDGFHCADVSGLTTISAQEAEVWLPFAKCFLYFPLQIQQLFVQPCGSHCRSRRSTWPTALSKH